MLEPHTWGNAHHIHTFHDWETRETEITYSFTDLEIEAVAGSPSGFLINTAFRTKLPKPTIAGKWRKVWEMTIG